MVTGQLGNSFTLREQSLATPCGRWTIVGLVRPRSPGVSNSPRLSWGVVYWVFIFYYVGSINPVFILSFSRSYQGEAVFS